MLMPSVLLAETVAVRHIESTVRGFLREFLSSSGEMHPLLTGSTYDPLRLDMAADLPWNAESRQ
jgi:hypothetical protein